MKIVVSNQLDEYVIKSLQDQQAPIDVFGVGTRLVTGHPDAALDGVYKLAMIDDEPRIKLSENIVKTTLPGVKEVYRLLNENGTFFGADAVALKEEEDVDIMYDPFLPNRTMDLRMLKKESLLNKVMERGRTSGTLPSLPRIAEYARKRLELLPAEFKRFDNPHVYKIGVSKSLLDLRTHLIDERKHETA
jgi:nicotinate phosphoribosyltransferase